jgi:hypothetical protein
MDPLKRHLARHSREVPRHSRAGGNLVISSTEIPAFAGMTDGEFRAFAGMTVECVA